MHNHAAIDLLIPTEHCYEFVALAFKYGFKGIGVNLTGDPKTRFIHLDRRQSEQGSIWSY